jgi:hypothetical protein
MPSAEAALDRMKATYACVNGVQGEARIDHQSPQGRIRGTVLPLLQNPDQVRIDVLAPVVTTMLFTLTSDGKQFQLLDMQRKEFLVGPAKACNLARLTQVPVPGHVLVSLLRGEAPVLKHDTGRSTIAWDGEGFYRVKLVGDNGSEEELHFGLRDGDADKPWEQQRVRVRRVRVSQQGYDWYDAELQNHAAIATAPAYEDPDGLDPPIPPNGPPCDAELPMSIQVRVPSTGEDVIFQYKKAAWNPPIRQGVFSQEQPAGTMRVPSDCDE